MEGNGRKKEQMTAKEKKTAKEERPEKKDRICKKERSAREDFSSEEKILLDLTKKSLTLKQRQEEKETSLAKEKLGEKEEYQSDEAQNWDQLLIMLQKHALLSLICPLIPCMKFPSKFEESVNLAGRTMVLQNYHLLFFAQYVVSILLDAGISVVLLKGITTASFYPVPELRKSGDIDLLLPDESQRELADRVLEGCGIKKTKEQVANHHIVYQSEEHLELELHIMLTEPFDNQKMNRYLKKMLPEIKNHSKIMDCMGVELPVLSDAFHAYYLLLHMLQHFLRSGFGIRLLCDWVVFWNREIKACEVEDYVRMVKESRIDGFASMVSSLCVRYLGLKAEEKKEKNRLWKTKDSLYYGEVKIADFFDEETSKQFLREILDAQEFGKSQEQRMVVLRGTNPGDYIREFHHQMRLNYPKAGRILLFWPPLWILTLIRFFYNNRKVRKTTFLHILKNAKNRGKLASKMHLFK